MQKAEILSRFEEELWQSSEHTKKSRMYYAEKFTKFAGDSDGWDKTTVIRFMKKLEKEGYSKGSQRQVYQIVKRVFDAAGITWPMGKRAAPKVQPSDIVKPSVSSSVVETMVTAAKEGKLLPDEAAFLALSTTYGLRREEMIRIGSEHIDYENERIYITTCKGGTERYQLIPQEIVPYLQAHDWDKLYSLTGLTIMYGNIEKKCGIVHTDGSGWHAIRRSLDTNLIQWNYIYTKMFLRWRLSGDMAIAYVTLDPLKVDRTVFEQAHPFLKFWR